MEDLVEHPVVLVVVGDASESVQHVLRQHDGTVRVSPRSESYILANYSGFLLRRIHKLHW